MIRMFSAHASLLDKLKAPPFKDKITITREIPDGPNHFIVEAIIAGDSGVGSHHVEIVLRHDSIVIKPWQALFDD
jgi:hypothetical protein